MVVEKVKTKKNKGASAKTNGEKGCGSCGDEDHLV